MKNCILLRRILLVSGTHIAALVLGTHAPAQGVHSVEPGRGSERMQSTQSTASVVYTFEGSVLAPNGKPAKGAVVVSSAGGQAITNSNGSFRLEVEVPFAAESVQLTAADRADGILLASRLLPLSVTLGNIPVAPLQLARNDACSPSWLPTFGGAPATDDEVNALTVFDDGSGAALYAGGTFDIAGGVAATRIAKWDGASWMPLGTGLGDFDIVESLTVFDDGGGEALYVGGRFTAAGGVAANNIAKWDGTSWAPLGSGSSSRVNALAVFDDGSGVALYAGGVFTTASGGVASSIAKWDGATWAALGSGLSSGPLTMAVFDDGGGPALYVGGDFTTAGGVAASRIAKWDGTSWSSLGGGMGGGFFGTTVNALAVFDDGGGAALYAGGDFQTAGGGAANFVAKWSGSNWAALGNGTNNLVHSLGVFDDGGGPAIFAGGIFTTAGVATTSRVAKWDGSGWAPTVFGLGGIGDSVNDFAVFDDGGGAELYAGGLFFNALGIGSNFVFAENIAKWDGTTWAGLGSGANDDVSALVVFDDGGGPALYAGGSFNVVGDAVASRIAKWDGSSWTSLGSGMNSRVRALAVFDDGTGDALYAGGTFTTSGGVTTNNIAKWDGATWSALGSGMISSGVNALAVFDDGFGEALYAGGFFSTSGGVTTNNIAKWDGTSWSALDSGTSSQVKALQVFDDGGGAALFVAGGFSTASGIAAARIARWDGSSWSPLGSGANLFGQTIFRALAVYDDGGGDALYAGGDFTNADGTPANKIAKWNGSSWSALGSGIGGAFGVYDLEVFDDGNGELLFAAGFFTTAGGGAASYIAKWDGASWSPLGNGVNFTSHVLEVFDDGAGDALFVGGQFQSAFDSGDSYLAKWGCPPPLPPALTGDVPDISLTTGGMQMLTLDGGAVRAGWLYFMFGSVTGTTPGIDFGGGVVLPLNFDVYFKLILNKPGLFTFGDFVGALDSTGQALATFKLPELMDPTLVGVTINHAYVAGSALGLAEFASNAVPVLLVP